MLGKRPAWKHLNKFFPGFFKGAVTIFKSRQPLYHVLSSTREVVPDNKTTGVERTKAKGMEIGFADLRGGLGAFHENSVSFNTQRPRVDYIKLFHVLKACEPFSRRHALRVNSLLNNNPNQSPLENEFAKAQISILSGKFNWPKQYSSSITDKELMLCLAFLKTVTKQ